MYSPQIGFKNIGSYRCLAAQPGCSGIVNGRKIVYYTPALYAESRDLREDLPVPAKPALYTASMQDAALVERWPIVREGDATYPYRLSVVDVALDDSRCFVLLEPYRGLASSRVKGRLRLDLLIADCQLRDGKLRYSSLRRLKDKQGSFIFPTLSIKGDAVVITDIYDVSSQQEDQLDIEREAQRGARSCVRIFRGKRARELRHVNSLCAPKDEVPGEPIVSPNAKFVLFPRRDDILIVGRDYPNNQHEPQWLSNED